MLTKLKKLLKSRIEIKFVYPEEKKKKVCKKRYSYKSNELPKHIRWTEDMLLYFSRPISKKDARKLSQKEKAMRYRAQQVVSQRKCRTNKK